MVVGGYRGRKASSSVPVRKRSHGKKGAMESPGRNLICAPANILSFWLFFATAVYHSVNSRCLCQFICSPIPRMKPIDNSMAYVYTVWEVWFCEPHVCFVFVESFTFIVFFPFSFLSYHINFLQVATQTPAGHTLALSQLTHLTPNTQQAN